MMNSTGCSQVSEFRFDPLTGSLALIAEKRRDRPNANFGARDSKKEKPPCPGCHPKLTPPSVMVLPVGAPSDEPGWKVRVVPNKYSCFTVGGENLRFESSQGLYGINDPAGSCEVVFETEHHRHPIHARSDEELRLLMRAMISRYEVAKANPLAKYFFAFKNHGCLAGGTLDHPHFQLYTLPIIPPVIQEQYDRAAQHFNRTGHSLYRDMFSAEVKSGDRLVAVTQHFISYIPFASGMQYEVCIAPKRDSAEFSTMSEAELTDFVRLFRDTFARLCALHPEMAFNVALRTAAIEHIKAPWYCCHVSILPRLTTPGGLEQGISVMVNQVAPEHAAANLRAVAVI